MDVEKLKVKKQWNIPGSLFFPELLFIKEKIKAKSITRYKRPLHNNKWYNSIGREALFVFACYRLKIHDKKSTKQNKKIDKTLKKLNIWFKNIFKIF